MRFRNLRLLNYVLSGSAQKPVGDDADLGRSCFRLLYDREPTQAEVSRLKAFGVHNGLAKRAVLRRIIAIHDRQTLPTPIIIRFSAEDVQWHDSDGHFLALDRADAAVSDHISGDVYEPHVTAALRRILKDGMTVADIGANIGYHTLFAAKLVGEQGQVLAFEPNSENVRLILMSKSRNGMDWIDVHPLALTDTVGNMFFSPFMGSNGGRLAQTEDVLASSQCMVVATQRLDNIALKALDVIKIDVEGGEALAIRGAHDTIRKFRPVIISEFAPNMLTQTSKIDPSMYISDILNLGYSASLLERHGDFNEVPIQDPIGFTSSFGSQERIEDLVFRPV